MSKVALLKTEAVMNGSAIHLWMFIFLSMLASSARAQEKNDIPFLDNYCVKCHWGGDNYLYQGYRRLYEGPKWIGDDFEIPIPPKHEYRMFLRENRSKGKFRIKLTLRNEPPTYGYGEHFLIKPEAPIAKSVAGQVVLQDLTDPRTVQIPEAGIYQVDVFLNPPAKVVVAADSSKLQQGLVGSWGLNGDTQSESKRKELTGKIEGGATFVDSPIGKQGKAISLEG